MKLVDLCDSILDMIEEYGQLDLVVDDGREISKPVTHFELGYYCEKKGRGVFESVDVSRERLAQHKITSLPPVNAIRISS